METTSLGTENVEWARRRQPDFRAADGAHGQRRGRGEACGIFVDRFSSHPSISWPWAFIVGSLLGFFSLLGDITGSFFKRRRGLKREGDVSSKAPLLDTLPFAMMVFLLGWLLLPGLHGEQDLLAPMLVLLVATPVLHRSFNMLGYAIGWKDVPY